MQCPLGEGNKQASRGVETFLSCPGSGRERTARETPHPNIRSRQMADQHHLDFLILRPYQLRDHDHFFHSLVCWCNRKAFFGDFNAALLHLEHPTTPNAEPTLALLNKYESAELDAYLNGTRAKSAWKLSWICVKTAQTLDQQGGHEDAR